MIRVVYSRQAMCENMYACICVWWWVGTRKHAIQVSYARCIRKIQPASTHMIKTEWLCFCFDLVWFEFVPKPSFPGNKCFFGPFFFSSNNRNDVNRIRLFCSSFSICQYYYCNYYFYYIFQFGCVFVSWQHI